MYVNPADTLVNAGDPFDVDIFVDNTGGGPLGGYSGFLDFDDTLLQGVDFVNDPDSNFSDLFDLSGGFGAGGTALLDLFVFGEPIAAQPAVFRLATVSFIALVDGVSKLNLSGVVLSNEDGSESITPQTTDGRVCIGGPCPVVPEPGLLALATAAAAAFGLRRRRQN